MTFQLATEKPTIKILLYTDDPQISESNSFDEFLGLGSMIEQMQAHAPAFANLATKWVCRSSDADHHADNKINVVLDREVAETGKPFDEIWFFGLHQGNKKTFSVRTFRGGPESELDANEVEALRQWMSTEDGFEGGGILMTGDHANAVPPNLLPNPDSPCGDAPADVGFLGLGRAIGRCVPRAGLLRQWEGPPTSRAIDRNNTLVNPGFQLDRFPQQLVLRNVNLDGDLDANGQPHPLFYYEQDQFIEVFPDHAHEGAVVTPDTLDASWPSGPKGQTQPQVVALGRNKRDDTDLNIIATYNGDLVGVGRIVADSTWHHYMNLNLLSFQHPAPVGSVSDQIGQFYGNLAVWLAPRRKRIAMARAMCWKLAQYTLLLEEPGDPGSIGESAYSTLLRTASPCEIHELMQVLSLTQTELVNQAAALEASFGEQSLPKLFLGSVLDAYHRVMIRTETEYQDSVNAASSESDLVIFERLIDAAVRRAFEEQAKRLRFNLEALSIATNKTNEERRTPMACDEPKQEWTIKTKTDNTGERGLLIFCLSIEGGKITGEVTEQPLDANANPVGDAVFLSEVSGTDQSLLPGSDIFFRTFNFTWGTSKVMMAGNAFLSTSPKTFDGRFTAFASAEMANEAAADSWGSITPQSPGDGDTGTGNGQQT